MNFNGINQIFESENIRFVQISVELVSDYLTMVNDIENVGRMIGRTEIISEEKELQFVRRKLEEKAPIFSMLEKKTGEFIGNIELMHAHDSVAELGIAVTKNKQDMGYGTEAILKTLEYAFDSLALKRVFLKVFPDNMRAIHVYEKCGFKEFDSTEKDVFMEIVR